MHLPRPGLLLLVLAPLLPAARGQSVLHVDASATPGGNGSTWSSAYDDLQAALFSAAANPGPDELWVAAGTYVGGFVVPDGDSLYGGFLAGQPRRDERRPTASETILDGAGAARVLDLGDGSLVDGFTVRNGRAPGFGGGGALVRRGSPHIRNCRFTGNTNASGRGSTLLVRNGATPVVESSIFWRNGDAFSGHVIDVDGAGGLYQNLVVHDNEENGLHMQSGSNPTLRNCVFTRNTGRGICVINFQDTPLMENNLIWNNGVSLMHVTGSELNTLGQVNALSYTYDTITGDPQFVDELGGDLRPSVGSPLIDAGFAGTIPSTPRDPDALPRVLDGDLNGRAVIDVGAHEFGHVRLSMSGLAQAGQRVTLTTSGTPGLATVLWIGARPTVQDDTPFGTIFLDLSRRRRLIATGTGPLVDSFRLPNSLPSGLPLVFQALVVDGSGTAGNWSNPVEFTLP